MLVSTTLAGPGAEASIVDALRSAAPLVDYHLIAFSGANRAVVERVIEANYYDGLKKVIYRDYSWPGSYGEARTEMLRWAESFGASWALTVDCDERLDIPYLEGAAGHDVATVGDRDALYQKPRFLRCGVGLRWEWPCAERLVGPDGKPPAMIRVPGSFWELPKDKAAELRRAERGVAHMPALLPNPHARRHLAECLLTLGREKEAEEHFWIVACQPNPDTPLFERTWSRYRLAELYCVGAEYSDALDMAGKALAADPGLIQELGWVCAYAHAQMKDFTAAALWASYVLMAPIDLSRGGHRGMTWKTGAEGLLASIEAAAKAQRPEMFTAEVFEDRSERFTEDYLTLGEALASITKARDCIDLGAGNGLLVHALHRAGLLCAGVEAAEASEQTPPETRPFIDFGVPLELWAGLKGDGLATQLVCCVEVAEHIPAERADELVDAVVSNSSRWIYWSAAQPGQGGLGHVNEQTPSYWQAKFEHRGWRTDIRATHALIDKLSGLQHCWWLAKNALLLRKF